MQPCTDTIIEDGAEDIDTVSNAPSAQRAILQ